MTSRLFVITQNENDNGYVGLLSCVKKKLEGRHPARSLYVSPLFNLASRYLDEHTDDWYVLSAKYGLVHKDRRISSYDQTLNSMSAAENLAWAERAWRDLESAISGFDSVLLIAGEKYRRNLVPRIEESGISCSVPLRGMGIGRQLAWLKRQTEA